MLLKAGQSGVHAYPKYQLWFCKNTLILKLIKQHSLKQSNYRHQTIFVLFFVQATSLNERNAFLVAFQVLEHLLHCNFLLLLGS